MQGHNDARRRFLKNSAYVTPAILSLKAAPAYAKKGSEKKDPGSSESPGRSEIKQSS